MPRNWKIIQILENGKFRKLSSKNKLSWECHTQETQVELQSYFNWGQVSVGGETANTLLMGGNNWGGDIAQC